MQPDNPDRPHGSVFLDAWSGTGTEISQQNFREQIKALSLILHRKGLDAGDVIVTVGLNTVSEPKLVN